MNKANISYYDHNNSQIFGLNIFSYAYYPKKCYCQHIYQYLILQKNREFKWISTKGLIKNDYNGNLDFSSG